MNMPEITVKYAIVRRRADTGQEFVMDDEFGSTPGIVKAKAAEFAKSNPKLDRELLVARIVKVEITVVGGMLS